MIISEHPLSEYILLRLLDENTQLTWDLHVYIQLLSWQLLQSPVLKKTYVKKTGEATKILF
jgi:hypothetical protein